MAPKTKTTTLPSSREALQQMLEAVIANDTALQVDAVLVAKAVLAQPGDEASFGARGGFARAASLSPAARRKAAQLAARARWGTPKKKTR